MILEARVLCLSVTLKTLAPVREPVCRAVKMKAQIAALVRVGGIKTSFLTCCLLN